MKSRMTWIRINFLALAMALTFFPLPALAAPLKQDGDLKAQADRLFSEGEELLQSEQLEAALAKFEEALPLYRKAGAPGNEAMCFLMIGVTKDKHSDYQGALEAYQASLPLLQYLNDHTQWIILNNIGIDYRRLGQYQQAMESYQKALNVADKVEDPSFKAKTLNNLGVVYLVLGEFRMALDAFEKVLPFREKGSEGEMLTLGNIGETYRNLRQYDQALKYFQRALAIAKDIGDQDRIGIIFNNLGLTHNEMREYQQAQDYYQQALGIFQETGNRAEEATTFNNLGKMYSEIGKDMQAFEYFQQAVARARKFILIQVIRLFMR